MSINKQIKKKNLAPDSVDGSKVKLLQDQSLRGINQLGEEVDLLKISQSGKSTTQGKEIALQEDLASEQDARIEGDDATLLEAKAHAVTQDALSLAEAKAHAIAQDALKLAEAKEYAELKVAEVKSEIMGGLSEATLDTISEIAAAIASEQTATGSILTQLGGLESSKASKVELAAGVAEAKSYTDAQIATIPEVDLSALETRVSNAEIDIVALEVYSKNIVHVDAVNGVDEIGRGSLLRPFKTINFAYSQVPSLGDPSNTSYNANVGKFVTEKLIINLSPGRYTENVVLGFKRARVQLKGDGATIIGDVKTSVKLADFPCAALENMKASFPAPFTGVSAFMNIEISGNGGGGLESDQTSSVFVITGQASLAFEESTVAGFGTGKNWDSSHGQFYASLDSVSVGNWVVTSSYTANMARALPSGVIEVDSSNIAASSATYRMFFGAVPYSYLTDFATWNVASKGAVNKAPNSGLTLKAHNSTFGNVIGPALTLGEIDGCRIYDIDRTMRGTVDNGSILGSTSSSYIGFVNNQFRVFSGSGDLASAYKLGQAVGATRYKMDSVSHTTLSFNRSSSGVLTARVLDLGGVIFDFLDDARSISVADPATNYTRTASTVDASLEGIDTALGLKASSASVISGNAASLSDSKAYTDLKISQIPSVDLSGYYNKTESDAKFALQSDLSSIDQSLMAAQEETALLRSEAFEAIGERNVRALEAEAALGSRIDSLIANTDPAALDSLSEIVTAFEAADSNLNGAITALGTSASSALAVEIARAEAAELVLTTADAAIRAELTAAEAAIRSDFAAADAVNKYLLDSLIQDVTTELLAVESELESQIEAQEVARSTADTNLQNNINSETAARESAISSVQSAIDAEETRAMGVEAQLQSDHDDLDGYAQDIRSDVDDLDGYAQDIRSDLDALQSAFDAQVDGPFYNKMKIEVSTNLATVELAHEAIANSIVVSVGRLMVHKDEDFTVSVVGGVTHLTWIGDMASPDGVEAIQSGDKVFVTYAY